LPNGLLLVANLLGAAVGCGALKLHIDTQIAEVKRMWVASEVRGLGLGRRLLERLSAEAVSRGMAILRLETNRSLYEAKHLYERAGFLATPMHRCGSPVGFAVPAVVVDSALARK
jgi:ribosomal protein S18 acetylase RimI-like enzyme